MGHHIRECGLLAAKNKKNMNTQIHVPHIHQIATATARIATTTVAAKVVTKNIYADLYSSDDEVEEGEIVEEDRRSRRPLLEVQTSDEKWTRSNIKGIVIMPCHSDTESTKSDDSDYDHEAIEKSIAESMAAMSVFLDQFRGRSWADIEFECDM